MSSTILTTLQENSGREAKRRASWQFEVSNAPYAERADVEQSALDRALLRIQRRFTALSSGGRVAALERMADAVDALEHEMRAFDDEQLSAAANELRGPLLRRGFDPALIARVFAVTREISRRCLGLRHHRVQIMGGWAMLLGALAEMETGEGKTITALLPSIAAALAGLPAHVVTVNDYLAERDAAQLRPVGLVKNGLAAEARRSAY